MSRAADRLAEALRMAGLGFPVVPLFEPIATGSMPVCSCEKSGKCRNIGKHPRWRKGSLENGAHSATTNEGTIREWWAVSPGANVGVATGQRAGLLVLDIDPRNGGNETLDALEAELGKLPDTVTVLTGGGGRHFYFAHPGAKTLGTLGAGVDLLGDGKLVVGPGSLHQSGKLYQFELSSEPGMIALAVLPESWKARICFSSGEGEHGGDRESSEDSDDREHEDTHPTPVIPAVPVRGDPEWTVDRLIRETVPKGPTQHDKRTMDFARGLRINLGVTDPDQAQPIFDRWFALARPNLADQDYDAGWFKFLRAFEGARVPLGAKDFATPALAAAKSKPLPKVADKVRGERARLLIGMCRELAATMRGPFKLSCHQIAALFGVKPAQAWEWLRGLERLKILKCIDRGKGGYAGHNAAMFEYLGD